MGDAVTTLIKCHNGQTILLSHDTSSPRSYSLNFRVQGHKGIWMIDNNSIYLEDESPSTHRWESFDNYREKYDHPLWKKYGKTAVDSGHDGCDYFIVRAFVEAVKRGKNPPMDVYDAVSMSVIVPMSDQSISMGNSAVDFPDFTRGKWKVNPPIFELEESY